MSTQATAVLDKEELRVLLAETIDVDVAEVTDDVDFIETLEVDSLMALEVIVVLEKKYGVKFAESEMRSVTTMQRAFETVRGKLADKG